MVLLLPVPEPLKSAVAARGIESLSVVPRWKFLATTVILQSWPFIRQPLCVPPIACGTPVMFFAETTPVMRFPVISTQVIPLPLASTVSDTSESSPAKVTKTLPAKDGDGTNVILRSTTLPVNVSASIT
ncbi:hypothetical protein D3C87_1351560 [compost metagenome]